MPSSARGRRLQAGGNLAAAVRWYLAHDRKPLPHLFRILWVFWNLGDHMGEVDAWAGQLLPPLTLSNPSLAPSCRGRRR